MESYQGRFVSPAQFTAFWNLPTGNTNAAEGVVDSPMPTACTFDRLYVLARAHTTAGVPAGGHNYTFTLRVNGVSTALSCSLVSVTSGTATCVSTNVVSVAVNDIVNGVVEDTTPGVVTTPIFPILYALNCR
jgi:hypothetical protein